MTGADRRSVAVHAHDRRGNAASHQRRGDARTTAGAFCPVASGVLLALAALEFRCTVSESFIGSVAVRWSSLIPAKRVKVTW